MIYAFFVKPSGKTHRRIMHWGLCLLISLQTLAQQNTVPDGYYTLAPFERSSSSILYTYDTDATRAPYGNATDYERPTGKNSEYAYLYATEGNKVLMARTIYYFQQRSDGTYTIQSCSGEAHSFLARAPYDRHLLCHTALPGKGFHLRPYAPDSIPDFGPSEYILQPYYSAAFCDSLACETQPLSSLSILQPVDSIRLTPAFLVRASLGYARGALAAYPAGFNPGQVPELCSSSLSSLIEQAVSTIADKNTTQEQSDNLILALRQATDTYLATAPQNILPVHEGYYFLRSAYRAFQLRQEKEKVALWGDDGRLQWGDQVANDGRQIFHLLPSSEGNFRILNYQGAPLCADEETGIPVYGEERLSQDVLFESDGEGMWRLAFTTQPQAFFFADRNSTGQKALYGKNTSDYIVASTTDWLFPGYCASWYLERAYHEVSFPSNGWAGLSTSFPVEVPEGIEVYTLRIDEDGTLCAVPFKGHIIPASTAVILRGPKGSVQFPSTIEEATSVEDNALLLCQTSLTGIPKSTIALLRVKDGQPGFSKSTSSSLPAGNICIPFTEGDADFRPLNFERYADGIAAPSNSENRQDDILYDLSGRRITHPRNIYIQNHKKVLNKGI